MSAADALVEARKRIEELEAHIARQNALINKWMLRFAKEEAKRGKVGTNEGKEAK